MEPGGVQAGALLQSAPSHQSAPVQKEAGSSYLQWPPMVQQILPGVPQQPVDPQQVQYYQLAPEAPATATYMMSQGGAATYGGWRPAQPQQASPAAAYEASAAPYGQWGGGAVASAQLMTPPRDTLPTVALASQGAPNANAQWSPQPYQGATVAYEQVPQAAWPAQAPMSGAAMYEQAPPPQQVQQLTQQQLQQLQQQVQQGGPMAAVPQMAQVVQSAPQGMTAVYEQVPQVVQSAPQVQQVQQMPQNMQGYMVQQMPPMQAYNVLGR